MSDRPRTRPRLAEALDLLPHPEGGWYRRTWETTVGFEPENYSGRRPSATGIYYLLEPGERSRWHRLPGDELWLWHRGGPLVLSLGGAGERPCATPEQVLLGPLVEQGQRPQVLVPGGIWQAAHPGGTGEVLVSCVVSPGFDFADFRMLEQE